jgi:hypothetical protein
MMENSGNLKEKYSFNLKNQVRSILSFKNENNENIIALGLEYIISEKCIPREEIYFYNLTNKSEWGFSLYSTSFSPETKDMFVDHLVFYLEDNSNYYVASRCTNNQNIYVFDYKTGEIMRRITVKRSDCLLFKSFKYRGTTRFAYDVNKNNVYIVDFETSSILFTILYNDFMPFEAKKIRFISNRLIISLLGKKSDGQCVIRLLDIESREIILEHGLENKINDRFFNLVPLRNITKFCKVYLNFSNDEVDCGSICLKYNIDGTIINEKCEEDENKNKKQRFLIKWGERNYELIDLLNDSIQVRDINSWRCIYLNKFSDKTYKVDKIKINNINYLVVVFENGKVNLYTK